MINKNKKGYYVYSSIAVIVIIGFFGFVFWLFYDLFLKMLDKDFSSNTVVQAMITLIITVFIGGFFSKYLEIRNAKKLELYKIQTEISLHLIDYANLYLNSPDNEDLKNLLICESMKVKLYFPDEVLKSVNDFICSESKVIPYGILMDKLKKNIQ